MCGWRTRISNRTDPQRSWTIKDMDLLGSQKTLVQGHFNWNFPERWMIHNVFNKDLLT